MQFIRTWCDLKLWHIQFNVINADTLKKAQKDPQKYRNLIVRIAGTAPTSSTFLLTCRMTDRPYRTGKLRLTPLRAGIQPPARASTLYPENIMKFIDFRFRPCVKAVVDSILNNPVFGGFVAETGFGSGPAPTWPKKWSCSRAWAASSSS